MWLVNSVEVEPINVSATGPIPKALYNNISNLGFSRIATQSDNFVQIDNRAVSLLILVSGRGIYIIQQLMRKSLIIIIDILDIPTIFFLSCARSVIKHTSNFNIFR